jgi:hypothetical protein
MWDLDPLEANNHYSKVLRISDCCQEQVLLRQVVDEVGLRWVRVSMGR